MQDQATQKHVLFAFRNSDHFKGSFKIHRAVRVD